MSQDLRRSLLAKLDPRRTASDVTPSQPQPQPLPAGLPSWKDFFQQNERVDLDDRGFSFNTYFSLPTTPDDALRASSPIPVFVFHHGAGSSALSFAPLAKALTDQLNGKCVVFGFDARGHGETRPFSTSQEPPQPDYSLDAFVTDFHRLLTHFYNTHLRNLQSSCSFVIVGHSLGGSISTNVYPRLEPDLRAKVVGLAMLDIVEETAILALKRVDTFLASTLNSFSSYSAAIDWHLQKGLSRLRSSAEIVVPSLFAPTTSGKVVRKTNLLTFKPFWDTWFTGLSHKFVTLPTSKLLILAGDDNLDRELIIGQMQGKYQLVVFQDSGHFIEEDAPLKTAITLIDFWTRNDNKNLVIKTNWTKK